MTRDLSTALGDNRAALLALGERLLSEPVLPQQRRLFLAYSRALGGHWRAIDEVVIPALKAHGWQGVRADALRGHVLLKQRMAELLSATSAPWVDGADPAASDAVMLAFVAEAQAVQRREGALLDPALAMLGDAAENASLAAEVDAQMGLLFDVDPPPRPQQPGGVVPRDLVEEARVVLGSWPKD